MSLLVHDHNKPSGPGGILRSLTKSLKPSGSRVPVVVNAKVVGGGADMPRLVHQLRNEALPGGAATTRNMARLLRTVSVSSATKIWYLERDLCSREHASFVRRSGL
ncbi:hypothetical protein METBISCDRAFT_28928 [Metschnikowia bicuspidata]|uniref:Uncharacterized protein n=1 Tax=Metschnikowia bicuspidata TaxID=27322 RepID=A0A4P9Z7M5_9ASCO|nr:hypothetical protein METBISCDRAFT_28928 [Metschnikowia bicuspidata]